MDAQAFRSPLAKFALALWMGCLHWPFTIPFVCALPLLPRNSKGRTQAWSMLMLFALGWTANSVQEAFDPVLTAPKTARWTCKRNAGTNTRKPQFTCVDLEPARRGWRIAHGVEFEMACKRNPRGSAAALLTAVFMGLLCLWIGLDSLDRMAGAPPHRSGVPLWTRYRRCIVNGRVHGDACTG